MQYIYNEDNIKKNFIASYADTIISENRLFIVNVLTDRQIVIEGKRNSLENFATKLKNGVSAMELETLLSELGVENLKDILLREGMIE